MTIFRKNTKSKYAFGLLLGISTGCGSNLDGGGANAEESNIDKLSQNIYEKDSKTRKSNLAEISKLQINDLDKQKDFLDKLFITGSPEYINSYFLSGKQLKSGLSDDFPFKDSGGSTIFNRILDLALGSNDKRTSRLFDSGDRSKLEILISKCCEKMKSGTAKKENLELILKYLKRSIEGNWLQTTTKLIDVLNNADKNDIGELGFAELYELFSKNNNDRWENAIISLTNLIPDKTFNDSENVHKGLLWYVAKKYDNVCKNTIRKLSNQTIPIKVNSLYIKELPNIISNRKYKECSYFFDYIVNQLKEDAATPTIIVSAIKEKANAAPFLNNLLRKLQNPTIIYKLCGPNKEYNSTFSKHSNIISLYASYFYGARELKEFLDLIKKLLNDDKKFKEYIKLAVNETSNKDAKQILIDKGFNG